MNRVLLSGLSLLMIVVVPAFPSAKGATTRITIIGGELAAPVEISNPGILERFNVRAGAGAFMNGVEESTGFIIDWSSDVVAEPVGLRRYEVSFYVKYPNQQADELAYVVTYECDGSTDQGYVYLPGPSDPAYVLNTNTIVRGREGNWFRASRSWQQIARTLL